MTLTDCYYTEDCMNETRDNIKLEADYLIVGCGAVGMAFADIILSETDANLIMVDKFHKPGGHWNLAYPFVTLHQPSAYYGVSSTQLGHDVKDKVGFNKGLKSLASGATINAYYDDIMREKFLPSGRVKFFPLCEYQGEGKFTSLLTGELYEVKVNQKLVDATYMKTKVPISHQPNFTVDAEAQFIPINDLPKIKETPSEFVIIGGGKTGIDACLWLLEHRVDPEKITWIVSRDAWLTDRKNLQPSEEDLKFFLNDQALQFESLEKASSISDLFDNLERAGVLIRIDQNVQPKMFRGATVSQLELIQLRRIKNVVRKGRVKHISKGEISFKNDSLVIQSGTVCVDCSATALSHGEDKPVFAGKTITVQAVRGGQIVFSAALIAHIEAAYKDENRKNELCRVVELPNHDTDWLKMLLGSMVNQRQWKQDKELSNWLYHNRLDGFSHLVANISTDDLELQEISERLHKSVKPAMIKLQKFVAELS